MSVNVRIYIHMYISCKLYCYVAIAPGAPPQNVTGQSTAIGTIQLSWSPPPLDRHYGIITGYFITYRIDGSNETPSNFTTSNLNTTIPQLQSNIPLLQSDITYMVTIAAVNGAGTSINISLVLRTIPERE